MTHLDESDLEALAVGEPLPGWAAASAHAGSCEACGAKLAGLRQEHDALSRFADQRDAPAEHLAQLWEGIEERLAPERKTPPLRLPLRIAGAVGK